MSQHLLVIMTQLPKKVVTDLLKTKAGTTYVNKEIAKNANTSSLSDYAQKTDVQSALDKVNQKADISDVDNLLPKSYLYFGFEENGGLQAGSFQWAFDNGIMEQTL